MSSRTFQTRAGRAQPLHGALVLLLCLGGCGLGDQRKPFAAAGDQTSGGGEDGVAIEDEATPPGQVMTASGPIAGALVDEGGTQVHVFRGVPYAAAPVGELRWKPPQPVEPWTEVRQATEWADRCPQPESRLVANGEISEDCLNLNVLTPSLDASSELPVMVFFHGGGLNIGTANSPTYSNTVLPALGVVVVTVNQRLGAIGYMAHPALAAESEHKASGNYGVLDQVAALKWVKANATKFGGDPDNVTIFGESGGGTKVLSCLGSPLCHGLFHRAIVQSGSRVAVEDGMAGRETAEQAGVAVATKLGIEPGDPEAAKKLRASSWQDILKAQPDFRANLAVDGWVFPQTIHQALKAGAQADVPLIVGANEGEAALLKTSVPELAAGMQSVSSNAYVYVFSRVPPGWQADSCAAFHGLELAYVFGHLPGAMETMTMRFLGKGAGCATDTDAAPDQVDQLVANNTMKMWTQFAKTGNPSVPGLIDWPAYTPGGDAYLDIDSELSVKTGVATSGVAAPGIGGTEN